MALLTVEELLRGSAAAVSGQELRGVAAVPGQKLSVMVGDKVRVKATVLYRGPALSDTFYGAIGERRITGFDEIIHGSVPFSFPASIAWVTYELTTDIPITTAIEPRADYDLYVKIMGHLEAGLPEVAKCIDVIGVPEFQNFQITDYSKV